MWNAQHILVLLQGEFVNQDWLTAGTIWHVPSKDHLQKTSSSRLHHSKNTWLYHPVLKKTSRDYLTSETLYALLAPDESLGGDSAQNRGYWTEQMSTWQFTNTMQVAEGQEIQWEFELPELLLVETIPELGHKLTGNMHMSTIAPMYPHTYPIPSCLDLE